jgi:hypothetical protein
MPIFAVTYSTYALWDFVSARGENVMLRWAEDGKLSKADRARLDQKLDRLAQTEFALAIGTKLLNGPIRKEIYKLIVHGQVMMRPLLCRGPFQKEMEYTLLIGAIERNWKLRPLTCLEEAAKNRETVIADRNRRRPHERFSTRP